MRVQTLGQEDHLEEEMATHSSILAWKIPWPEKPGGLEFIRSQRIRHDWACTFPSLIPETLNFLPMQGCMYVLFPWIWVTVYLPLWFSSVQLLSHVWLCDPMDCSMPGLLIHHQVPEFTQTQVHWVSDAIQPSQPTSLVDRTQKKWHHASLGA